MTTTTTICNHANTLVSADPTITTPTEIHVLDDGRATACHADSGDESYDDLGALCLAYGLDIDAVTALPTTTHAPTLATIRATLAAAEQRLAAANDEMEAAQEAHDDATAAVAAAIDALAARAANVRPSICAGRAWDVDVTLCDVDGSVVAAGEVTLKVGERDGRPSSWGDLDHWVSDSLRCTLTGHRDLALAVEHVAREAIEASAVPASPEYEG